jgi:hypothetical protein
MMNAHGRLIQIEDTCREMTEKIRVPMRWEEFSKHEEKMIERLHRMMNDATTLLGDLRWNRS